MKELTDLIRENETIKNEIVNNYVLAMPNIAGQFQNDYNIKPTVAWELAPKYAIKCLIKYANRVK